LPGRRSADPGDDQHPVAKVRRPDAIRDPERLGGADERRRQALVVAAQPAEVVADRERLRRGRDQQRLESALAQEQGDARTGEVVDMLAVSCVAPLFERRRDQAAYGTRPST
jgi:hypothetical protein